MARRRALLEMEGGTDEAARALIEHKWSLFLELMRFAEGGSCRHDAVLRYFADEEETLAGCGRCDVCERLARDDAGSADFSPDEVTLLVRKALSGVARIHGRFGLTAAVQLLRGEKDPRLARSRLDGTTTFGILREFREDWLLRVLRRCVTAGWVDFLGADRPVAALTEEGVAVMRGDRPVRLLLPPRYGEPAVPRRPASGRRRSAQEAPMDTLDADASTLFEQLRAHRLEVARSSGVPPYVVATDRSLREIAAVRPHTSDALLAVHGMGPAKVQRYGEGLLEVVRSAGGTSPE
jgi:ATP-dependent DNA helicase RecQ